MHEEQTKGKFCTCQWCTTWYPLQQRILSVLSPEDQELFERWLLKTAMDEEDLAVAKSKLEGKWPGWEWMAEWREHHGLDPRNGWNANL